MEMVSTMSLTPALAQLTSAPLVSSNVTLATRVPHCPSHGSEASPPPPHASRALIEARARRRGVLCMAAHSISSTAHERAQDRAVAARLVDAGRRAEQDDRFAARD